MTVALVDELAEPPARTILINAAATEDDQRHALVAGAAALVTPDATSEDLEAIIAAVHRGLTVMPPTQAPTVAGRLQHLPDIAPITANQTRLLRLLAAGHTLTESAAIVGCSERHARRQLRRLWDAFGARNQTSGIVQAARYGLLEPGSGDLLVHEQWSERWPTLEEIPRPRSASGHEDQCAQGGGP